MRRESKLVGGMQANLHVSVSWRALLPVKPDYPLAPWSCSTPEDAGLCPYGADVARDLHIGRALCDAHAYLGKHGARRGRSSIPTICFLTTASGGRLWCAGGGLDRMKRTVQPRPTNSPQRLLAATCRLSPPSSTRPMSQRTGGLAAGGR